MDNIKKLKLIFQRAEIILQFFWLKRCSKNISSFSLLHVWDGIIKKFDIYSDFCVPGHAIIVIIIWLLLEFFHEMLATSHKVHENNIKPYIFL